MFLSSALNAGVVDSKAYNNSKKKFISIPEDFKTFPGKGKEMTESVQIPITELPTHGESRQQLSNSLRDICVTHGRRKIRYVTDPLGKLRGFVESRSSIIGHANV